MRALEFRRSEVRYARAAIASRLRPGSGARNGPLHLVDADVPDLPTNDWVRVRTRLAGICGSDLSTVEGQSSRYFEPWVSFPFVPGHEVVGTTEDGRRVVLEPVLGHAARGFEPPFEGAAPGDGNDYRHLVSGSLEPGIQTGYCTTTGGGWSQEFVAHPSQLHDVPEHLSDEAAVMIEPAAVGVHAALRAPIQSTDCVAIIGAGTAGLTALAAVRRFCDPATIIVAAKYPEQVELATSLGADQVVAPGELVRAVRRATSSHMIGNDLSGGADVVIDAVGSQTSVQQAIGIARPRGAVVLVGMPGRISLDMTALWHRETELLGCYTYGTEVLDPSRTERRRPEQGATTTSFALAIDLVESADLGRLVSACYPLTSYEDALDHAANAGSRGSIKICFDLR